MCPMQSRMAGFSINELPNILAEDPYQNTHAVIFNNPLNPNQPLIISLVFKGVLFISHPVSQKQFSMGMSQSLVLT